METKINNSQNKNQHYELPLGWKWVRLGEVCEIDTNPVLPQSSEAKRLPYIGLEDIESGTGKVMGNRNNKDNKNVRSITFMFDSRHVLYGKLRPYLNKVVTPTFVGRCSTELLPLLPKENCYRYYLAWLLRRSETVEYAMRHKTGTRMPRADMDNLFKMLVPLAPMPSQRRITAKLQELMQDVENARYACKKQLEAAKVLPSAYLREVFESAEAKKWERKRLGEVCKIFSGSPAPQNKRYFQNGEHPFVRVHDLAKYKRTTELVETNDCINDDAIKELQLVKAKKGTILFPKSGAAIRTNNRAILGLDAYIVSHLAAISPRPEFADTYFVYYWLCLADMVHLMENPGYPSLKLSTVSKTSIPLPPVSTQRRVASELKETMNYIDRLESLIQDQQSALGVLYETILKKAFRGEL